MKINKFKKLIIATTVITMLSSQLVFARGSASAGHSSPSHSTSVSHSTPSPKSTPSSSAKSGSFSSKSTTTKPSLSKPFTTTKPNTSSTATKPSTTVHNTTVINNTYHYIPSATYRTSYGIIYRPSFFDNYWFYRSLMHHNTVVVVNNGVEQQVSYGHSDVWKDIVTLLVVIGVVTVIVIFIRKRRY